MQKNEVTTVHPAIRAASRLLNRSVEMGEAAFNGVTSGAVDAKDCNVMLGAARVLQGAARLDIAHQLMAPRLAMQNAKLVEQTQNK